MEYKTYTRTLEEKDTGYVQRLYVWREGSRTLIVPCVIRQTKTHLSWYVCGIG